MEKQREHWGSRLGFLLAAAGSAVGLGTLWKFPYVTGENGGGIFVLVYAACTLFIGLPVFMAELILGRRAQRGPVGIFVALSKNSAFWKTAGWLGVAGSFVIMSYYSVVAGWGINYTLMSLNQFPENHTPEQIKAIFETLISSGDITLFWHFIFTALTVAVVYPGVRQGIEYWTKFMTIGLFLLLVLLTGYSFTLDGFAEGARFILYPDLAHFKPSAALEALGLAFFTLSLGQGIMLTYGSYMRRTEDIPQTGFIIGATILIASLLAGLMIFPIIFTFNFEPQGGPGLVFKTLPVLFAKLPAPALISTTFFVMLVFTALTSSVAMVEVLVANFMDLLGWTRKKAVLIVGIACFIFGIPSALSHSDSLFANWGLIYGKTFFDTMDQLVSIWILPMGGLLVALFTGWVLDKEIMRDEFMSGTTMPWLYKPFRFFIRWVAPVGIALIVFQKTGVVDVDSLFNLGAVPR